MCQQCLDEHRETLEAHSWPRSPYRPPAGDDIVSIDFEAMFWERFEARHVGVPAVLTIDPAEFKRRWEQLWTEYRASAQSRVVTSW